MQPAIYHADAVATVMEALSCYNYNNVQPVIWEMVLGSKLSDAPDDAEMFSIVRDSTFVDLSYAFVNVGGGPQALQFILNQTTSGNVVSYVEKYKPKSLTAIEKVNNTYPAVNG